MLKATKHKHQVCHISAHSAGSGSWNGSLLAALQLWFTPSSQRCFSAVWHMLSGMSAEMRRGPKCKAISCLFYCKAQPCCLPIVWLPQVICQAWQAPYYFLTFDCPLCHSTTLLLCHVISLILLTSSERYLAIYNGGNVSCQKMVPGNGMWETQRKLKWE